jgi:DNA-binding transcriptional regulator LsrR (DeoR family)
MPDHVITERFLKALDRYFSGDVNAREAAREADLRGPNRFLALLKEAYRRGYVTIRSPIDHHLCERFRQWVGLSLKLEAYVVKGKPDYRTFSLKSAEVFLVYLKRLLTNDSVREINIGIVSGSTTALLVDALVTSPLWGEVLTASEEEGIRGKRIRVIGLTANPVKGWGLQGDANMCAYRLAVLLREKLVAERPEGNNEVEPWGMTNSVVVKKQSKSQPGLEPIPIDRIVLQTTDPDRLKHDGSKSKLDIVITGIGAPEHSLITDILRSEQIQVPENAVGYCAYTPIDKDGHALALTKDGSTYSVYSAIRLPILSELVEAGKTVMLVVRNSRVGVTGPVNKTPVIRATLRGKYANVICTDEETAEEVMRKPI